MRLLIYTHEFTPFIGGLGTTSMILAKGLSHRGFETVVLAPSYPQADKKQDSSYNFEICRMGTLARNHGVPSPVKEINGYISLKRKIASFRPDALISLTREAHAACGINTSILPDMTIARVAGYEALRFLMGSRLKNRLLALPMKRFYQHCSWIVSASSATRDLLCEAGLDGRRIKVVYNGVNTDMVGSEVSESGVNEIRSSLGLKQTDTILLTVSRLVPGKGQDMVIRAVSRLVSKHKNLKYLVVGEGPYSSELAKLARQCGVESNVIFTGSVPYEDTKHYYDVSDVFLMPNRTEKNRENVEGLPNVIYEAASRGKPIIAGIPGGAKEIVETGFCGFIVDGNDIEQITTRLEELLENEEKRLEFGNRLRSIIKEKYTTKHMIDQYELLLKS